LALVADPLIADPNERKRHEPGPCTGCGADLATASDVGMERRQVFDLLPMTAQVTEHQLITRRCRCGASNLRRRPGGGERAGAVRVTDHRDHPLPVM